MYLFPTFFYSGYFPYMPGTFGSLVALCLALFTLHFFGIFYLVVLTAILTILYFLSVPRLLEEIKQPDPQIIVADEVIGQWAVILFLPRYDLLNFCLSILLFRFFDILKPFPINYLDKKSKKGKYFNQSVYILADDLMASFYSITFLYLLNICKTYLLLIS